MDLFWAAINILKTSFFPFAARPVLGSFAEITKTLSFFVFGIESFVRLANASLSTTRVLSRRTVPNFELLAINMQDTLTV